MIKAKETGKCIEITVNHFHRSLEPLTVELPDSSTVRTLKRHISRLDFAGQKVCGAGLRLGSRQCAMTGDRGGYGTYLVSLRRV